MKRQIAMTVYVVGVVSALLVSLVNPHGVAITLTSAVAASFGGTAGLFNLAYSRRDRTRLRGTSTSVAILY